MKKLFFLSFLTCFLFSYTVLASSYSQLPSVTSITIKDAIEITPKPLEITNHRGIVINGIVPSVSGSTILSNQIERIVSSETGSATSSGASKLTFDYTIMQSETHTTISFLIKSAVSSGSSMDKVSTVVINKNTLKVVSVSDLLGSNGLKIATSVVNDYINANYRNMPRINTLSSSANFYVADDAIYFLFNKYEIAPGSEGIQAVPVYFDKVNTLVLEKDEFYNSTDKYNVRMLPLRKVSEHFNYSVKWVSDEDAIQIRGEESSADSSYAPVKLNENSYKRIDDEATQILESPPEKRDDGSTYVPISFFESILDIYCHVMPNGTIELSIYEN